MRHERAVKLLADYAVGRLRGRAKIAIEQHISQCPICERELMALQKVEKLLCETGLFRPSNPKLLLARIRKETLTRRSLSKQVKAWKFTLSVSWKPALSLALLTLLLALAFSFLRPTGEKPNLTISYEQYHRIASWGNPLGNWIEAGIGEAGAQP